MYVYTGDNGDIEIYRAIYREISRYIDVYVYIYCMSVYVYVERERETERER